MRLSKMKEIPTTRRMTEVFGGYNHRLRIGDGEFYDMENLSSRGYPAITPRPERGIYAKVAAASMISMAVLCYVMGTYFVIGNDRYDLGLCDGAKTLVQMGSYVIILPDKKYINTAEPSDCGSIESVYATHSTVTISLCDEKGYNYPTDPANPAAYPTNKPEAPGNGAYWLDWDGKAMMRYSLERDEWMKVPAYIRISSDGIGESFRVGDTVEITFTFDGDTVVDDVSWPTMGAHTVIAKTANCLIIDGLIFETGEQEEPITVSRTMPEMDFVIESGNRLWGCRYGLNARGELVNEIYASKLGDFKNWSCFRGISTDSYAATVGTDGAFTGAVNYLGNPVFFKEHCMHTVYGNQPSGYRINTTMCRGVQEGSERSLAVVDEVLYYKARGAVCAYDGSLPAEVSDALGDIRYGGAVAGACGGKYYISMADEAGTYRMFVYDTRLRLWHKEDRTRALAFCAHKGDLYYIDARDCFIKTAEARDKNGAKGVRWFAETGIIGTDSPDKKTVSRLDVRMKVAIGAQVDILVEYDSSGDWERLYTMEGTSVQSFAVPVRPRRCDHLRLRIEGRGNAQILSICKTVEGGSDL